MLLYFSKPAVPGHDHNVQLNSAMSSPKSTERIHIKLISAGILLLLFVLCIAPANATIRRVGFFGVPLPGIDYISFAAANTAANTGDTIYVYPGSASVVSGNINKKLIVIGSGTWIDSTTTPRGNGSLQAFAGTSLAANLSFLTGSSGSVVMGFDFQSSSVFIGDNNITLRRNLNMVVTLSTNPNTPGNNSTPQTLTNIQCLENYRLTLNSNYAGSVYTALNISNNLITNIIMNTASTYSGSISNNVWAYDQTLSSALNGGATTMSNVNQIDFGNGTFLFQNNILNSYTSPSAASNTNYFSFLNSNNTVFNYNVALQGYNFNGWGVSGTGNITSPISSYNTFFQGFPPIGTRSADDRYMLGANSPGLIANRPGSTVDAGLFGGISPYKLSTIPSIPTIYKLSSPQGNNPTGTTIQINISTRGNN